MSEELSDEWEGHWFNPVAFAEKWLEEEWQNHRPKELRRYLEGLVRRGEDKVQGEDDPCVP